nr:PREDICTED: folylpolyglutamate synthase, mitochondrial-like isoform X4 [Megachile rotundata]
MNILLKKKVVQYRCNYQFLEIDLPAAVHAIYAALKALTSLQSNAQYLKIATKNNSNTFCKILEAKKYLLRVGITLEKLDTLSVIHVAGTKGKGSTCAYTEAILQQFWAVYKKLEDTKEHECDMPMYFKFLTILMFNIFLDANVDVAIIEVGIGGEQDCTNIVRNPVCVGITSLALEHTSLLGNTIEAIAYQKSGIFKPKTFAFTVPQLPQAMSVLEERAMEKDCTLHLVPPFQEYRWQNLSPILNITNSIQQQNASLAIQMAITWMAKSDKYSDSSYNILNNSKFYRNRNAQLSIATKQAQLPNIIDVDKIAVGLASCKWPGRMQILESSIGNFYLDGAHTFESIEHCISWFNDLTGKNRGKKFLIFNTSGTRDPTKLLVPLKTLHFYKAYFVPNFAGIKSVDDEANCLSIDEQRFKCEINSKTWGPDSIVANSVNEALQDIKKNSKQEVNYNNDEKYQILITGSLHLIGAALAVLDPNLTMRTQF